MDHPDENLLLRWSRRKHQARQEKTPEPAPVQPAAAAAPDQPTASSPAPVAAEPTPAPAGDAAPVRVEDLPDIETLTYESDFSVFLRDGVPEFIRQQALRKLWVSNPILANLDGLNGYDPMNMKALDDLEGAAEPIAEVGRSLRDKIMEDKRTRDDNLHERRARPRGRRQNRRDTVVAAPPAEDKVEPVAGTAEAADPKPHES
jgi:Protein of unknown function (DUF3306)